MWRNAGIVTMAILLGLLVYVWFARISDEGLSDDAPKGAEGPLIGLRWPSPNVSNSVPGVELNVGSGYGTLAVDIVVDQDRGEVMSGALSSAPRVCTLPHAANSNAGGWTGSKKPICARADVKSAGTPQAAGPGVVAIATFEVPAGAYDIFGVDAPSGFALASAVGGAKGTGVVRAQSTTRVLLKLVPGESIAGKIVDSEGSPIEGASIILTGPDLTQPYGATGVGSALAATISDESGKYSLPVPFGVVGASVCSQPPAYAACCIPLWGRMPRQAPDLVCGVESTISGRLVADPGVDGGGGGFQGVEVQAMLGNVVVSSAHADETGAFRIVGLGPSRVQVVVRDGNWVTASGVDVVVRPAEDVADVEVPVVWSLSFSGVVVVERGGVCAAGAPLLYGPSQLWGRSLSPPGEPLEFTGLPVGDFNLELSCIGSPAAASIPIQLRRGETREHERWVVNVGGAGAFNVVVVDDQGTPLNLAQVRLFGASTSGNRVSATAVTDESGRASIRGLEAGEYTLSARAQDGMAKGSSESTQLAADAVMDLRLTAVPTGGLRITVLGTGQKPIAGAVVVARDAEDRARQAETSLAGEALLEGLAPGVAIVSVSLPAVSDGTDATPVKSQEVNVKARSVTEVTVAAADLATTCARATLAFADGSIASDITVQLKLTRGIMAAATSDATGRVQFDGLPPGIPVTLLANFPEAPNTAVAALPCSKETKIQAPGTGSIKGLIGPDVAADGWEVEVFRGEDRSPSVVTHGTTEDFRLAAAPEGPIRVQVATRRCRGITSATVRAGQTTELALLSCIPASGGP